MKFGGQTITFHHFEKSGIPDELGNYTMVPTSTPAPWCRHRPLAFSEIVEFNLDIATEWWKSTVPVNEYDNTLRTVVMTAKAQDSITVDGQDYEIFGGVRTHPDINGIPFKTTIISQKHAG